MPAKERMCLPSIIGDRQRGSAMEGFPESVKIEPGFFQAF